MGLGLLSALLAATVAAVLIWLQRWARAAPPPEAGWGETQPMFSWRTPVAWAGGSLAFYAALRRLLDPTGGEHTFLAGAAVIFAGACLAAGHRGYRRDKPHESEPRIRALMMHHFLILYSAEWLLFILILFSRMGNIR